MSPGTKSWDEINLDFQALSPALQSSIKKVIQKEHFTQYEITVKDLNTRGNNFLGKLYEMDIKCKTPEVEKVINIFIKEKIVLDSLSVLNLDQLYANEVLVYKDLSKTFTYLQDQANVPSKERFKIAKAFDETTSGALILENLHLKGFRIYDKAEPLPLKFFELGVKELAKWHALSFVIEHKLPEYFKKNYAVLENPIIFNEDMEGLLRNICKYVANLYEDETKIKIEKFVPVLLEKLPKYLNDKTNVCTLSHGDYKKNNIMVRSIDGEPVELIAVDYQFIDYGCPMRDLLFFIFTATDREIRRKHLNDIKELYFETLSKFLIYFDMDVEAVYPRKEFEKIYTEWLDYGLMMTLFAMFTMFAPETGIDFENVPLTKIPFCPDKKYEHLFRGLIDDFVQWGLL